MDAPNSAPLKSIINLDPKQKKIYVEEQHASYCAIRMNNSGAVRVCLSPQLVLVVVSDDANNDAVNDGLRSPPSVTDIPDLYCGSSGNLQGSPGA
jgi:hypothetical protein